MISAGKVRNAAYNNHHSSELSGARSHVPSTFLRTHHGDSFEGEITPADSASNVDYWSATSSPKKTNGFAQVHTERRIESIQRSAGHNARTRARSPTKENMTNMTDRKDSTEFQSSRRTSRMVEKLSTYPPKNEKALSEHASGKKADLGDWIVLRTDPFPQHHGSRMYLFNLIPQRH